MSNLSAQPLKSISDVSGELEQIVRLHCIKFELEGKRLRLSHTISKMRMTAKRERERNWTCFGEHEHCSTVNII